MPDRTGSDDYRSTFDDAIGVPPPSTVDVPGLLVRERQPFVYISFGSFLSIRADVQARVVAALRRMDVRVALAIGSATTAIVAISALTVTLASATPSGRKTGTPTVAASPHPTTTTTTTISRDLLDHSYPEPTRTKFPTRTKPGSTLVHRPTGRDKRLAAAVQAAIPKLGQSATPPMRWSAPFAMIPPEYLEVYPGTAQCMAAMTNELVQVSAAAIAGSAYHGDLSVSVMLGRHSQCTKPGRTVIATRTDTCTKRPDGTTIVTSTVPRAQSRDGKPYADSYVVEVTRSDATQVTVNWSNRPVGAASPLSLADLTAFALNPAFQFGR